MSDTTIYTIAITFGVVFFLCFVVGVIIILHTWNEHARKSKWVDPSDYRDVVDCGGLPMSEVMDRMSDDIDIAKPRQCTDVGKLYVDEGLTLEFTNCDPSGQSQYPKIKQS